MPFHDVNVLIEINWDQHPLSWFAPKYNQKGKISAEHKFSSPPYISLKHGRSHNPLQLSLVEVSTYLMNNEETCALVPLSSSSVDFICFTALCWVDVGVPLWSESLRFDADRFTFPFAPHCKTFHCSVFIFAHLLLVILAEFNWSH